jgi:DNA processing protein
VPGAPGDTRAQGCLDLIKDGAACVTEAADVLAALPDSPPRAAIRKRRAAAPERTGETTPEVPAPTVTSTPPQGRDAAREALLAGLGPAPTPVDELTRRCQLSPAAVAEALLELELAGRIERHPGNQAALI